MKTAEAVFFLPLKKRRKLSRRGIGQEGILEINSLDINTGVEKLRPEDLLQREIPGSIYDAFVRARAWHRDNWFIEQVCLIRAGFSNYGLKILPLRPNAKRKLQAALEDPNTRWELLRFINTVWSEWDMLDTVVGFWKKEAKIRPFLLLPETCEYTDAMGIERLRVALNYQKKDLEDEGKNGVRGLDPSTLVRYAGLSKKIFLSEKNDEYYKILTRGMKGQGFGWPRMRRVFRTLSQNESMEVGEQMLALAGRLVEREHHIGFEVRSGANAMRQESFLYKKPRADAIQKYYQGRAGFSEAVKQFDHKTSYNWVDPKWYDARKWETIVTRLLWWSGPVGYLLLAKSPNPYLLPVLHAQITADRQMVGAFCEAVIAEGWGLNVKLEWSDRPFQDSRLAWDMVKFFTQQGPLSLQTGLGDAGFDADQERERKAEEAAAPREEFLPLFDPAHGKRPGEPDGPGKPPGTKNTKPGPGKPGSSAGGNA